MLTLSCIQPLVAMNDDLNRCCKQEEACESDAFLQESDNVFLAFENLSIQSSSSCCDNTTCNNLPSDEDNDKSCCDCKNPFCCFKIQKVTFFQFQNKWTINQFGPSKTISLRTQTLEDYWNPEIWHPPV